mmetsp:Transcript_19504/g.61065  ORF Transcript_19504/g.61065 Transcript_19504/m.61065 type:complete len:312 (+) Transcript_19504:595-1530(+)
MRLVLASLCATAAARINGVPSPSFSPGLNEFQVGLGASAALLCVGVVADGFAFVTQGHACLVERLGRYDRTLEAGLHPKIPVIERVVALESIRERVLDVPAQRCITSDNAPLSADAVVFYRITDMRKAKYAIDDYSQGVSNLVLTQLRSEIGQLTLDETFSARERLNAILLHEANSVTHAWGIEVVRVEVRDILPSPDIVSAMYRRLSQKSSTGSRRRRGYNMDHPSSSATKARRSQFTNDPRRKPRRRRDPSAGNYRWRRSAGSVPRCSSLKAKEKRRSTWRRRGATRRCWRRKASDGAWKRKRLAWPPR